LDALSESDEAAEEEEEEDATCLRFDDVLYRGGALADEDEERMAVKDLDSPKARAKTRNRVVVVALTDEFRFLLLLVAAVASTIILVSEKEDAEIIVVFVCRLAPRGCVCLFYNNKLKKKRDKKSCREDVD